MIPFSALIFGFSFLIFNNSCLNGISKENFPSSLPLKIFSSNLIGSLSFSLVPDNLIIIYSPLFSKVESNWKSPGISTLTIILLSFT